MTSIFGYIAESHPDSVNAHLDGMIGRCPFANMAMGRRRVVDGAGLAVCPWKPGLEKTASIASDDRSVVVAMAGEIYNLETLSISMSIGRTAAKDPAAVLAALYREHGIDFVRDCNGIFVIALWDPDERRLLLVRDHMGSRSVFYAAGDRKICFATAIQSLLATGDIRPALRTDAVNRYLAGTVVPHPDTMFEGIWSLAPGHVMIFKDGRIRMHRYWPLESLTEDHRSPAIGFQERIRTIVVDAVNRRWEAGGRMGCVLSGGVDSSTIAALMIEAGQRPLEVFSITYDEKAYDDSDLQQIMLAKFDLNANVARIGARDVPELLQRVVAASDVPVNNASAMGTLRCFDLAAEKVDIVFDGEAADELFCGGGGVVGEHFIEYFDMFPVALRRPLFGIIGPDMQMDRCGLTAKLRRFCHRLTQEPDVRMLTWLPAFDRASRLKLLQGKYLLAAQGDNPLSNALRYMNESALVDPINRYQYGSCMTYLCNDLLYKNERMAAACRVVNRTPFIDYRLAELAFVIPSRFKLAKTARGGSEKKLIYRKALQDIIPDEILWRPKMRGFSQPIAEWMCGPLKDFVTDILCDRCTRHRGIFHMPYVERLLQLHIDRQVNIDRLIWGMLTLELWLRHHYDA